MTARALSWTPATIVTNASRVIMPHMIWLAEMFSDPYFGGHETTRLHSDGECGSRWWHPGPLTIRRSEETGSDRARDVRRPSRDGGESRADTRSSPRDRIHRRRAAVVLQSLWSHALAGGGDAQERRTARALVSHVGRHDLRRVGAQPRNGEAARPPVSHRPRFRGLDQADTRRLARVGRSLQRGGGGGPESGHLAGLPKRGLPPEADRRADPVRRLHQPPRSHGHAAPTRRRQHADRRRRSHAVSAEVSGTLLALPSERRGRRSLARHRAGKGHLRLQAIPGGRAAPRTEACVRGAGDGERLGRGYGGCPREL